jgi:hypothetical protein
VVSFTAAGRVTSNGIAKRLRQSGAGAPSSRFQVMQIVECGQCRDRFAITHESAAADAALATRQAVWLQDQFVWDHIQESKHRSSIALPAGEELGEARGQVAAPHA